ncbi:MAG: methionyl-tRNA formyltransferase [Chloroflexi bacterium]|nr:methionyl-tRNA formyltransferase [Chloroflexota bacterium]
MSRVVFFGSPSDATTSLHAINVAGHEIAAVYTRPDRPAGRSGDPVQTPVKSAALEMGLEVATPESLRNPDEHSALRSLGADAFLVVAYGRLLPAGVLEIPPMGILNLHPSLLPLYRGPSPVATAILEGVETTGVTVILLDEGMDTGPVLARSEPIPIREDDTKDSLTSRLFELGARLLVGTLEGVERGSITPIAQDEARATTTRLLKRADGEIDWAKPADQIERQVRAYDSWPGTFTSWGSRNLKIIAARALPGDLGEPGMAPGQVEVAGESLFIGTGDGRIEAIRVQLEGRRAVSASEFLRGQSSIAGTTLGD